MAEATANSKEKKEIKVSTIILPENKNYESESLKYEIKIPNWLLENIQNYEVSNNKNDANQNLIVKAFKVAYEAQKTRCCRNPCFTYIILLLLRAPGLSESL